METRKLEDRLSVAAQLQPADISDAAAAGFRAIINNRPDGEETGQPTSSEIQAAAQAAGLAYQYIPITPGRFGADNIAAFEQAVAAMPGPVLAYCRTGTRSATMWGLCNVADMGADGVIAAAAEAGCDISGARPLLLQIAD